MPAPNISESEWIVMEQLWERAPRTAGEIARTLKRSTGWAENTVRTLITRLAEKGALRVVSDGGPRQFEPAIDRDSCVKAESASFLDRVFRGSAKPLLLHFAENTKLTADEVRELKQLLDRSVKR
ncbi:MAG TPA: BlaI/MecI/CopY family transcriptional regulator [Chthoniobacteraceae bacterium]|nr:BlaI/MecI/CopY family transcriptional regulator [Chthoniobacteraceae bacterium]